MDVHVTPGNVIDSEPILKRIDRIEEICMCCPHKDKCLGEKSKYKTIRGHVWEDHKDDNKNFLRTEKGKGIYDIRKETVERSFADSKNLHGLRYVRRAFFNKL